MPMDPRKRAMHGSRRGKVGEDLTAAAKNVGPLAASFVPGVGEAMDAKDLYSSVKGGDWLGAGLSAGALGLGLIPGVGDAAAAGLRSAKQFGRGVKMAAKGNPYGKHAMKGALGIGRQAKGPLAPEIAYATNKFMDPIPNLSKKEEIAAGLLGPGERGRRIVADMKREFADPSLSTGEVFQPQKLRDKLPGPYRPGGDDLWYKRYQTPEGDYVHSTYGGGRPRNVLGGTERNMTKPYDQTVGGQRRPSTEFETVTKAMVAEGDTRPQAMMKDLVAPLGAPKAAAGAGPVEQLMAKQGWSKEKAERMAKIMGLI